MNGLYLVLAITVSAMTLCGGLIRAARSILRAALAGRQLATAVHANTVATDALATTMRSYQASTDQRLNRLEHRGRPHP